MHFHLTKPSFSFSFSFPSVGAFRLSKSVVSKYKCIDKDIPIAPPLPRPISKSPINQHREEQKQGQEVEELNELNLREKVLYLESIGVDSYRAVGENSQISTTGLESIESVVKLLQSMGIDKNDIGRLAGMCPEELTLSTRQLRGVFTFLLREAKIPLRNIKSMQPARNINEVINISSTESTGSSSLSKYQPRSINIQNDEHDDCSSVDNISVGSNNYNQNEISITTHNRQTLVEEVTSLAASVETRCERICATIANTPLHLHQIGDEDLLPLYVDTTHHKLEGMKTILREIAYEQHGNGDRAPQFDVVFKQYLRDL